MFANAELYERFMGRWSRLIAARLIEFADVRGHGKLLDIGSGTGALAFALAELRTSAQVFGVDPSKEYVAYAGSLNPAPERIRFETGNAQHLQFDDRTFAACVSSLAFNFIPDPLKALEEARRVTESGGIVAAAVWDYGGNMQMLRKFWEAATSLDQGAARLDESQMPLCRSGELAGLWTKAGLDNIDEQPLDIDMRFESFDDYWQPFLFGQGPAGAYAASLDASALHRLRVELLRRLALPGEDTPFSLPARAWAVRGTAPQ